MLEYYIETDFSDRLLVDYQLNGKIRMFIGLYMVFGLIILILVGTWLCKNRIQGIAASRTNEKFEDFQTSFAGRNVPPEVILTVYNELQNWNSDAIKDFPVHAEDSIGQIYGIANETVDGIVLKILTKCSRSLPSDKELEQLRPLITVENLVIFIASCPKRTSKEEI